MDAKEAKGGGGDAKSYKGGGGFEESEWSDDGGESKAESKDGGGGGGGGGDGSAFDERRAAWPHGGARYTPVCRGAFARGLALVCCEPPKWRGEEMELVPSELPATVEAGEEAEASIGVKRNGDIDDDHTATSSFDADDGILFLADGNVSGQHCSITLKANHLGGGGGGGSADCVVTDSSSNGTHLLARASDSRRWLELSMEKHVEVSLVGVSYVRFGLSMVFAVRPAASGELGFGPSEAWAERTGDGGKTEAQLREEGFDEIDQEAYRDMPGYF